MKEKKMKVLKKSVPIIAILILLISVNLYSNILYKISGKVIYNGVFLENITVECISNNNGMMKKAITDPNGEFIFYVNDGIYTLQIPITNKTEYVSHEIAKFITVDKKNVKNVIFILEKECKVSGNIKFADDTPIGNAIITVGNKRSRSMTRSNNNGYYCVSGLRASDNTIINVIIPGVGFRAIDNLMLTEGSTLQNIDFIIPKKLSIKVKIFDSDSNSLITDAIVMISDKEYNILAENKENGEYHFYNLEKNNYWIIIDHPKYVDYDSLNLISQPTLFSGDVKSVDIGIKKIMEIN